MKWRAPVLLLVVLIAASGQPRAAFEVASVRRNPSSSSRPRIEFPPGRDRFVAENVSLSLLIVAAYGLTIPQLSWNKAALPFLQERYDIQAKAAGPATRARMLEMLQGLLEERFKLVLRRETRQLQAYALVVDKGGLKIHPNAAPPLAAEEAPLNPFHATGTERRGGHMVFTDETMEEFAFCLSRMLVLENRIVVDRTDVRGTFDFELKFGSEMADPSPGSLGPSIFVAIRELLGLKLEPLRMPVTVLNIEHAEWASGN